jgi:glutaredoxin-related protein
MKKVFLFGSTECPGCMEMKGFLELNQVRYSFIDILGGLGKLKMFLEYRDKLPAFEAVKQRHTIGLPLLVVNDGEWTSLDEPSEAMLPHLRD